MRLSYTDSIALRDDGEGRSRVYAFRGEKLNM